MPSFYPDFVDLDAYCKRIDLPIIGPPTIETLRSIHFAHATHIPFENLDILLGRSISMDPVAIQRKLILAKRGGYCFEQNTLLASVLEQCGFSISRHLARVHFNVTVPVPRLHKVLLVEHNNTTYLADVGFGTFGLFEPIPLWSGHIAAQYGWSYQIIQQKGVWTLQKLDETGWTDLYSILVQPLEPIDFEPANHYTSTHPSSRFTKTLTVQRLDSDRRLLLINQEFTVITPGHRDTQFLKTEVERLSLLRDTFSLEFPIGTEFGMR